MLDDDFLKALHHVLFEVSNSSLIPYATHFITSFHFQIHVEEGAMICPNCGHAYPISNGIPNMVCDKTLSTVFCSHSLHRYSSSRNTRLAKCLIANNGRLRTLPPRSRKSHPMDQADRAIFTFASRQL